MTRPAAALLLALALAVAGPAMAGEGGGAMPSVATDFAAAWRAAGQPSLWLSWQEAGSDPWDPAARQGLLAAFRRAGVPLVPAPAEAAGGWRIEPVATPAGGLAVRLVALADGRTGALLTAGEGRGGGLAAIEGAATPVLAAGELAEAVMMTLQREWTAAEIACPDWRRRMGRGS